MHTNNIPVPLRFQWLNHPCLINILEKLFKPAHTGRKGYGKVWLLRWLIYKHLSGFSYRDIASLTNTGIDHSTLVHFKQNLIKTLWLPKAFKELIAQIIAQLKSLHLVLDSTFVETYSGHDENGSSYSGYYQKNGFKLHKLIDFQTDLPLLQIATYGSAADVIFGVHLIRAAPKEWNVTALVADKGYDSDEFRGQIKQKWQDAQLGIPLRRTNQEARNAKRRETFWNKLLKAFLRFPTQRLMNTRSSIERHFSRDKRVFKLGEERTRHLKNFRANAYLVSIMRILEWSVKQIEKWLFFTKLQKSSI